MVQGAIRDGNSADPWQNWVGRLAPFCGSHGEQRALRTTDRAFLTTPPTQIPCAHLPACRTAAMENLQQQLARVEALRQAEAEASAARWGAAVGAAISVKAQPPRLRIGSTQSLFAYSPQAHQNRLPVVHGNLAWPFGTGCAPLRPALRSIISVLLLTAGATEPSLPSRPGSANLSRRWRWWSTASMATAPPRQSRCARSRPALQPVSLGIGLVTPLWLGPCVRWPPASSAVAGLQQSPCAAFSLDQSVLVPCPSKHVSFVQVFSALCRAPALSLAATRPAGGRTGG